jgi:hypothetical protein
METRAIFAALIVLLFWLAPKPSSSEAQQATRTALTRVITPDDPRISIKPYVAPTQAK